MRILINTGHPAQIHNFKYLKSKLEARGHTVFWLASDKDISKYLLDCYGINYTILPRPGKSFPAKLYTLIRNVFFLIGFLRRNKIDLALSRVSPYVAVAAWLLRKPHIALTDTETAGIYDLIFGRFASVLLTATSFKRTLRKDQIRFHGNIELFYLHPNQFQPKEDIYNLLGINKGEPYMIMRFVSWDAYHDKGLKGFTDSNKIKAVKAFSKYVRVFVSTEKSMPLELEPYRINIPPEKMHDALAYSSLFFGESATMASESAVLGTPAIFLNENWFGSTEEEQNHGLLFSFKSNQHDQEAAIEKGIALLSDPKTKSNMKDRMQIFLGGKIDMTQFFVWFVENYPESFMIMKNNPKFQMKFN